MYVEGINFTEGDTYSITFGYGSPFSQLVVPTTTTVTIREGTIFATTFRVPVCPRGQYVIYITTSPGNFPSLFTVTPQVTLSALSGYVGDQVTVSGTGFNADSTVTIYFDSTSVGTATTDSSGIFTNATFTVPESYRGSYTVKGSDISGDSPSINFITLQKITVTPASGVDGDQITISGTGFAPNSNITFYWDNASVSVDTITTNANGSFTNNTFIIPSCPRGSHTVKVRDILNNFADTTFTIVGQKITITPATGASGTTVAVTGTGFSAKAPITIIYDTIQVATATTDISGTFEATFIVPKSKYGPHDITISDGTDTITQVFTMESDAPPIPVPLLPETGTKAKSQAYFDWGDVTDPSGVTYTLQIASDANFTTTVLEREGLTASEYTITKEEKLPSTTKEAPYYWRVRAVDGASNESQWSTPRSFYVGFSMPSWALYTIIVIGALLLGVLGFWLSRRTTHSY